CWSSRFLFAPFLFLFALHGRVLWILALTSDGPSLLRWYNLSPISIPHGISGIPIDWQPLVDLVAQPKYLPNIVSALLDHRFESRKPDEHVIQVKSMNFAAKSWLQV